MQKNTTAPCPGVHSIDASPSQPDCLSRKQQPTMDKDLQHGPHTVHEKLDHELSVIHPLEHAYWFSTSSNYISVS